MSKEKINLLQQQLVECQNIEKQHKLMNGKLYKEVDKLKKENEQLKKENEVKRFRIYST